MHFKLFDAKAICFQQHNNNKTLVQNFSNSMYLGIFLNESFNTFLKNVAQ